MLAWQRTALSLVVAAAVLARLIVGRLGYVAVGVLAVAAVLALWVLAESRWRYAQHRGERERQRPRGGRGTAFLALATALIALVEAIGLLEGP